MSLATSLLDDNLQPAKPYRIPVMTPESKAVPTATLVVVKAVKVKAVKAIVKTTGRTRLKRNHAKPHAHPVAYNAHTGNGVRQGQRNSVRLTELVRDVLYPQECVANAYDGGYEERVRADAERSQASRKTRKILKLKAKVGHGFYHLDRETPSNWAIA